MEEYSPIQKAVLPSQTCSMHALSVDVIKTAGKRVQLLATGIAGMVGVSLCDTMTGL
jgi:hypothetical protein